MKLCDCGVVIGIMVCVAFFCGMQINKWLDEENIEEVACAAEMTHHN